MKLKISVLLLSTLLACYQGTSQNRIKINIPSADSETDYIWRTIQDIDFFEKNNYQVSLPKGGFMDVLKSKAREKTLSGSDLKLLKGFIKDSVYNESDYKNGFEKIAKEIELINKMVNEICNSKWDWHFKEYETYQINLTLYGPGGSYDPDKGSILIYTSPQGRFKQYDNPSYTIIHEIVHIGIEESIVNKFNVPHALKERIVDAIVSLYFKEYLPDYKIQNMGDNRIDPYLKNKEDLFTLEKHVEKVIKQVK